jgi:hypothetical protein
MAQRIQKISNWILPRTDFVRIFLAASLLIFIVASCKNDADMDPGSTARNVISGVADGIDFRSFNMVSIKDSNDVFIMVGTLGRGGSILAAFAGTEEMEYPIAEEGSLAALTNYLNELIAADSFFIDTTALQEIFSDSAQLLPDGTSFIFYVPDEIPFFSVRGNITLNHFDGTINRIYGTLEGEFINADDGPKYINSVFEDLFYVDCPLVTNCGF